MYLLSYMRVGNGYFLYLSIALVSFGFWNGTIDAQSVPPRFRLDPLEVAIGSHDGNGEQEEVMFQQLIDRGNAPWIQLTFDQVELGKASFVRITSVTNGDHQELDARMMRTWNFASGIFHGGRLQVELVVAPQDRQVTLEIGSAVVGERKQPHDHGHQETQCGNTDDRVLSNDGRIGRLFFGGCSAFLASNGSAITAGHCSPPNGVMEFNVPLSTEDGFSVPAAIEDQYPITPDYAEWWDDGAFDIGRDWGVFSIGRNSQTGARAHVVQGFTRCSRVLPALSASLRITGFGADSSPLERNKVQQTDTGPYRGSGSDEDGLWVNYHVDTEPASSGSPVLRSDFNMAFGVHTNGGCDANASSFNSGTAFELNELEDFINSFWGSNVEQVDPVQAVLSTVNGSIMQPWPTLASGIDALQAGGVLVVVEGTYNETPTLTKAMTIQAPVGTVTIGQ